MTRTMGALTCAIVVLVLLCEPVQAQGYGEHPDHPTLSETAAGHIHLVNELGSRRRSNTLFRNEQSLERGAQISYVNVGAGNLTFARRDLVVVGRIPLVFARVYDSSGPAGSDFGPGWRIASAESIQVAGRDLRLLDESGSTVTFRVVEGNRYEPVKPHSSAVLRLLRTAPDEVTAELQGGWRRTFRFDSGAYRLVEVTDRFDNSVALRYQDGVLHEIAAPTGRYLRILRSTAGRISGIEDNSGRGVRYQYDPAGRLTAVFDAGGNEWRYTYDQKHRLTSMTNPEGFQELSAHYHPAGRVRQVFANGLDRTFKYKRERQTEVRDSVMGIAQFTQDKDGITVGVRSFAGDGTHIELDDDHQVVELYGDAGVTAEFRYQDKHLKMTRVHTGTATRQVNYGYDGEGRLASIEGVLSDAPSAPADTLHLEYDPRGPLSSWSSSDQRRSYEYSPSGDLTQVTLNSHTYTFASDADGQIASSGDASGKNLNFTYRTDGKLERTTYWDGTAVRYEHDALGTRSFGDWAEQGSVVYTYDRSGNAREILITSSTGENGGHTIEMDAQQRVRSVTYGDGQSLTVTYDAAGNPKRIVSSAGDDMRYEYDASNRLPRIVSNESEDLNYDYAPTERDLRTQGDHKTMRTILAARRASVAFGSSFEIVQTRTQGMPLSVVVFDDELVAFRLVSSTAAVLEDAAIYDGLSRMRLIHSGREDFADKDRFEQPSNVLFLPPEYVSINCCIPCSVPPHFLCGRCVFDGNGEPIVCYCAPPPPPPALSLSVSQTSVWPSGTSGPNTLTATARISPAVANAPITFSATAVSGSGGHAGHSGTRSSGTFAPGSGSTAGDGRLTSTWTAPFFGGQVTVSATWGSQTASGTINVRVPSLQQLPAGTNYNVVGSTATHPVNNYGTPTAVAGLMNIADDYRAMFYTSTPPSAERLRYNDMSLLWGGYFDLASNWCTNCSHFEHREGRNCDVGSSNVPQSRWAALTAIFVNRGSPGFLDETATASHWHLRF